MMVRRLECRLWAFTPWSPKKVVMPESARVSWCVMCWIVRQAAKSSGWSKVPQRTPRRWSPRCAPCFHWTPECFFRSSPHSCWHYLKCFLILFDTLFFNVLKDGWRSLERLPWPSRSLEIEWLLKMKKAPLVKSSAHPHTARNARNHIWTYLKLGREASCWCAEKSDAKLRILEVYLQLGPVRCCFCSHSCPVALLLLSSIQSLWHRVGRNDYRLRLFTGCHF